MLTLQTPSSAASAHPSSENAPPLLLAHTYSDKFDPSFYLVSEKLDGVRAFWDGARLRFRSGRLIHAPTWFTEHLPNHALDGELWMGRKSFDRLSAAVRREMPHDDEWRNITYQLYELPDAAGSFAQRYQALLAIAAKTNLSWLQVLAQTPATTKEALKTQLQQIAIGGGEGLMLHRADAPWQTGRSEVLLKLKPQLDAEAIVIAYEAGKGKYLGMLGALVLELPDGKRLRLGTGFSDEQRRHPPAIGTSVSYRYRDLTSTGLPKFASFLRVREPE